MRFRTALGLSPVPRTVSSGVFFLAALLIAAGLIGEAQADRVFGDDVLASGEPTGTEWHSTQSAGQHCIGVRGDTVFVVWYDRSLVGYGIYLSRSVNAGESFEPPRPVSDTTAVKLYRPSLALGTGGEPYVVWQDRRDGLGPGYNIYFSRSVDGGETFDPDVRVDDAGDHQSAQTDAAVAVDDSGRVYVVWRDSRGGFYFSRSLDGGLTFSSNIGFPIPESVYYQHGPAIAAAGDGLICISYIDEKLHAPERMYVTVRRSIDCGATFNAPVVVDSCDGDAATMRPSIVAPCVDDVYVAWDVLDDWCVVAKSVDGGASFGPSVQVNEIAAGVNVLVSLAANPSGWVTVVWDEGGSTLGLAESRDGGQSFLPTVYLGGPGNREYSTVTMDSDESVYLAWTDEQHSPYGDIYFSSGMLYPPAGIDPAEWDEHSPLGTIWARPNPFRTDVTVEFGPEVRSADFAIYDLNGRLLRRLSGHDGSVVWDGLDENGNRVAPGVYVVKALGEATGSGTKLIHCR